MRRCLDLSPGIGEELEPRLSETFVYICTSLFLWHPRVSYAVLRFDSISLLPASSVPAFKRVGLCLYLYSSGSEHDALQI